VQTLHAGVEWSIVELANYEGAFVCVCKGMCVALAMQNVGDVRAGVAAELRLMPPPPVDFF
jgi:hypothetical protein